jgi:hypothetical protein
LAKLVRRPDLGIELNEHYEGDGEIIFKHARKLGCERSALARSIGLDARRIGSRSRTRRHRRSGERPKRIGARDNPRAGNCEAYR